MVPTIEILFDLSRDPDVERRRRSIRIKAVKEEKTLQKITIPAAREAQEHARARVLLKLFVHHLMIIPDWWLLFFYANRGYCFLSSSFSVRK
ncbi:hypothetical protein N665_0142s0010 [Sinapis alba]|nr:hypothetical protein N665_0142s0010 [Sinapis alba]